MDQANVTTSYTQNQMVSAPVQTTVVTPKVQTTTNTAAAPTFEPTNAQHVRSIGTFLQSKGQVGLFDTLAKRLVGKPFTKETVESEWAVINPEAPDKEPEVVE
jgi:hypothetical protein